MNNSSICIKISICSKNIPFLFLYLARGRALPGKLPRQLEIVLLSDVCNRNRGLRWSAIDRTNDSDVLSINLPRPNNALSFYLNQKKKYGMQQTSCIRLAVIMLVRLECLSLLTYF